MIFLWAGPGLKRGACPNPSIPPYGALADEIAAVVAGEADDIARMASVAAMVASAFPEFLWTGFYRVDPARPRELVVAPYQGALGCLRIPFGKGVCGAAAARGEPIVVTDVEAFEGHIACDPRSRSEIVLPVYDPGGALIAVFDVDSAERGAFDDMDVTGLGEILRRVFAG